MKRPPLRRSAAFAGLPTESAVDRADPALGELAAFGVLGAPVRMLARRDRAAMTDHSLAPHTAPVFPVKLFRLHIAAGLTLERIAGAHMPEGASVELSVSPAAALRIIAHGRELVGVSAGAVHRFTSVPTGTLELSIEWVAYADPAWDGIATITLTTRIGAWAPIVQRACIDADPDRSSA